jgi:hypothetical protein
MTGQDLLSQVKSLRDAFKTSDKGVLGRIFDLNDKHFANKTKRNCVNCATECLARLTMLAKQYLNEEIPMKSIIKPNKLGSVTLIKYDIPRPFRPFGESKLYANFNTTDEEIERFLKLAPQHTLYVTMADGSPFEFVKNKKTVVKKEEPKETE